MSGFIRAPTIDVWMYVNLPVKELFYEMPIEELIGQRTKLETECRGG